MSELLSSDEIAFILKDLEHPRYLNNERHLSVRKTEIMQISSSTGLIFFYGNLDTGFMHMYNYHAFGSLEVNFSSKKANHKSSFSPDVIPFFHYLKLADEIYKMGELNEIKNTSPDLFDLYYGYSNISGVNTQYKLLLYKGTKIIHNLHPMQDYKTYNIGAGKNARNSLNYSHSLDDDKIKVEIPYYNISGETTFMICIELWDYNRLVTIYKIENNIKVKQKVFPVEQMSRKASMIDAQSYRVSNLSAYSKEFPNIKDPIS